MTARAFFTRHSRSAWLVLTTVIVGVYAVALFVIGGSDALDALRTARTDAAAGALALQVAVAMTWPLVHRASLRAMGADLDYPAVLQVSMSTFTVSHTVPGGGAFGAAVAVERLTRFGIAAPVATASVSLTGSLSLTTIAGLAASGIVVAVATGALSTSLLLPTLLLMVALLLVVVAILAAIRSPSLGERLISATGRLHPRLADHVERWQEAWRSPSTRTPTVPGLARIVGWSAVKWTADIGSLALVFVAFDESPRLMVLLVGFGAAQLLAMVPLTPGAVGFVEGGMVGAFALLGIARGPATTIVLTYRILETWLPAAAGLPVLLRPRRSR